MNQLNFSGPINSLSLGNVSICFLKELYKKNIKTNIFPVSGNCDLSAFNLLEDDFVSWLEESKENNLKNYNSETPTLKVWHIRGSEHMLGVNQFLYTFYEVDSPTQEEINIVKAQKHVFFSCSFAAKKFEEMGCNNVSYVPLGLDDSLVKTKKQYLENDVIHFGLTGKFEKRKNTALIIRSWLKLFGGNPKYQLTCLVTNPFFKKEQMENVLQMTIGGESFSNLNFLPRLKTNEEVNDFINSIDIDLSGLSNGEGWNLPAFNATALGKWSVVSDCSSHKDWANEENSILIKPDGKQECYDNIFFKKGSRFNQGNYFLIEEKTISDAIKKSVSYAQTENKNGMRLAEDFTYENSINLILDTINEKK